MCILRKMFFIFYNNKIFIFFKLHLNLHNLMLFWSGFIGRIFQPPWQVNVHKSTSAAAKDGVCECVQIRRRYTDTSRLHQIHLPYM